MAAPTTSLGRPEFGTGDGISQRNTDAEKIDIKAGKVPHEWKDKPAKAAPEPEGPGVKFSKAKMAQNGRAQQRDIVIPAFGYKKAVRTAG